MMYDQTSAFIFFERTDKSVENYVLFALALRFITCKRKIINIIFITTFLLT